MNLIWKVSDQEVSSVIRYLDPDFRADLKVQKRGAALGSRPWVRLGLATVAIGVALYFIVLRHLQVVMRLLN